MVCSACCCIGIILPLGVLLPLYRTIFDDTAFMDSVILVVLLLMSGCGALFCLRHSLYPIATTKLKPRAVEQVRDGLFRIDRVELGAQ